MGLLVRLLFVKETYLVLGLLFVGVAGITYFTARPSQPVEIDGTESSYVEYTKSGNYDRNELQLVGDNTTYVLDKTTFHPNLPEQVYKNGKMKIWVDQGSTTIIAITLYDQNDETPIKYTTAHYENPASERTDAQTGAIPLAILGLVAIAVYGLWFALARRRLMALTAVGPALGLPVPGTGTNTGLSPDGRWFWDGVLWRNVSADGSHRWDGAQWQELTTTDSAPADAPPPPSH